MARSVAVGYPHGEMIQVRADFEEDLCVMAEQELHTRGIPRWPWKQPRPRERRDVIRQLLTVEHRAIPPTPRLSVWSDVLIARSGDNWLQEARRISSESESGKDLNHYLSTRVGRALPDAQLNDWGMTHLHLGGRQSSSSYSLRSDELLFVVIRPKELYFVDIGSHASFSAGHLFEAVHRNWPQLIARGRVEGVIADHLTDVERAAIRSKNGNATTVTSDGTAYLAPGLGSVASGISSWVVVEADRMVDEARQFQKVCESNADNLVAAATKIGISPPAPTLDLSLTESGEKLVAQEVGGRFWIWMKRGSAELKMSNHPPPA